MLKRLVNEARLRLHLQTTGPLLVKSGHATMLGPDMTPVLVYRNGQRQVYLPGSSLKGVFRSHLEKIGRTFNERVICDPFVKVEDRAEVRNGRLACPEYAGVACSDKFEVRQKEKLKVGGQSWNHREEKLTNPQVYADSCPICRLFGSTSYIGRVSIGDAYLVNEANARPTEVRDGVGIDRLTGGAANRAKFELEVVSPEITFETEIVLRNFESWQLGMLLLVAQDLADGLIRVGSGRSRGLGAVTGRLAAVEVGYIGHVSDKPAEAVWGLGHFLAQEETRYGTHTDDSLTVTPAPTEERRGIRLVSSFRGDSLAALQQATVTQVMQRLTNWQVAPGMTFEHLQFRAG
jgi:CRISPR-associated RAMP protein (TIGR02581 family)